MKSRIPLIACLVAMIFMLTCFAFGTSPGAVLAPHADILGALGLMGFAGSILTQGSQLYAIDPETDTVLPISCITAFNPGGAPADQLDDTCMDDTSGARTFKRGLTTPGQATATINADPKNASHVRLFELSQGIANTNLKWALGWSDGPIDSNGDLPQPTGVDSDGDFILPTNRTFLLFEGYVADFPFDFQINALVTSDVSVQRSGPLAWVVATT